MSKCFLAFVCLATSVSIAADRANILLIVADDLGYSDLGCYGSEIETPRLDALAREGLRFSHFRATPMCVTSRIALLSGMPMDRAGAQSYAHAIPLPILMKRAGYRTLMTGKWHAGSPDPRSRKLFDRSFGFLGGMTDSFVGSDDWFLDAQPFTDFPAGFYSTRAFATKSIEFMKESVVLDRPFFMYAALNAPHHPCQAPEATVRKYADRYRRGYDAIRHERHARQIQSGLVDEAWAMSPLGADVRDWDQITQHRRDVESSRMAAYAAAVDEVDAAVGAMLDYVNEAGIADKTLVVFMSDNGGDYSNGSLDGDERQVAWQPHGNPSSSNGWAAVKATPFRFYKHTCHEGGIAVPMIVRYPDAQTRPRGDTVRVPTSITDLYPTCLELAGLRYPETFAGQRTRSLTGSSLVPLLAASGTRSSPPLFEFYDFSKGWIEDEWKAVNLYNGPWQLFDLTQDRGETNDLSRVEPARLAELRDRWARFASQSGIPSASDEAKFIQPGWGWHRVKMAYPHLVSMEPDTASVVPSTTVTLRMTFDAPIDFRETKGKSIRVYSVSDELAPILTLDPDPSHTAQGARTIDLGTLDGLLPGQQYFVLSDPGWIRVGGRPSGPLNDGAYWWRFTTSKALDGGDDQQTNEVSR